MQPLKNAAVSTFQQKMVGRDFCRINTAQRHTPPAEILLEGVMIGESNAISNDLLDVRTEPSRELVGSMRGSASSAFGCQFLVLSFSAVLLPLGAPSILYTHPYVYLVACICKPPGVRMTRLQFAAICSCSPPHDVKGVTGCCSIRPPRFNPSRLKPQH